MAGGEIALFTISNDARDVPEGRGDDVMYIAIRRRPLADPVEEFGLWGVLAIAIGATLPVTEDNRCPGDIGSQGASVVRLYDGETQVGDTVAQSGRFARRRSAVLLTDGNTGRTEASVNVDKSLFQDSTQFVPALAEASFHASPSPPSPPPPPTHNRWYAAIVKPGHYDQQNCRYRTSEIYGDWQEIKLNQHWTIRGCIWSSYVWQLVG